MAVELRSCLESPASGSRSSKGRNVRSRRFLPVVTAAALAALGAGCSPAQAGCSSISVNVDGAGPDISSLTGLYRDWLELYLHGLLRVPEGGACKLNLRLIARPGKQGYRWVATVEGASRPFSAGDDLSNGKPGWVTSATVHQLVAKLVEEGLVDDPAGGMTTTLSETKLRELICPGSSLWRDDSKLAAIPRSYLIERKRTELGEPSCAECRGVIEKLRPEFIEFRSAEDVYSEYRLRHGEVGAAKALTLERMGSLGLGVQGPGLYRVKVAPGKYPEQQILTTERVASPAAEAVLVSEQRGFAYGGYSIAAWTAQLRSRDGRRLASVRNASFTLQGERFENLFRPETFSCLPVRVGLIDFYTHIQNPGR
jgi:hypothetical protein